MTDKPSDIYGSISISGQPSDKKITLGPPPPPEEPEQPKKQKTPKKPARQSSRRRRQIDEPPPRRRSGRFFLWFFLLVLLFGTYSAAGYLLVPYLVQNKLPDYLAGKTGAYLTTGRISFNPYNFKLVARDISAQTMKDGQPRERFLTIDDLRINLDFLSLLRGDLTCSEMRMERLKLQIVRYQDKSYNISYLLDAPSLKDHSEIIDFAELPFLFSFNNISVAESRVLIDDQISGKEHVIKDIELALPVISNFPYQTDSYIHPRFSAVINGSPVSLSGEASFAGAAQPDRETQLSCDINDIDIPLYFDYLPLTLPIDISEGTANGVLHLTFSPEEKQGSRFKIRFNLETTGLGLESRDSKLSLKMPGARLEGELEPFTRALSFKSILLREPEIIAYSEKDATIGETLASLAPLALRPPEDDKLHQVIPPIAVKLLIAEGGTFTVQDPRSKKTLQQWNAIQLNIKNFTNDRSFPTEEESLFRLSGENSSTTSFFTWQGNFDNQNRPGGNIQISSIPAALVAPFLGRTPKDISGTADLKGLLLLEAAKEKDSPLDYTLKSSQLTIKDLVLKEGGKTWLATPVMRCDPVSRVNGITDLGNIYMHNSTVSLQRDRLPYLFLILSTRPTRHILHGIDFSGSVTLAGNGKMKPTVTMRDVIFQANKLERQETQKQNFVYSAALGSGSEIKAKGSLHIAPLQINTQLSATSISPNLLFSWFSDSPSLLNNQAVISVIGSFLYPQQEFRGELAAEKVVIGPDKARPFKAATIHFSGLTWSKARRSVTVKKLLADQPTFMWYRLDREADAVQRTSTFLRSLLLPDTDPSDKNPDQTLAQYTVGIDEIGISNGLITYLDERTKPTLELTINGVNGEIENMRYPAADKTSTIALNGSVAGYPFKIAGEGSLLQSPPSARVEFTATSVPLSLFSQQIEGRVKNIDTDEATVSISHQVDLNEQSPSYKTRFELSNLVPETPGTNLATAFALMAKDGTTVIEIEGDQKPTRAAIDEALDTFSRSMVKASINPLLLADPKFANLVEKEFVAFVPGTDQFTAESFAQLNRYGELLAAYPLINLTISGQADPESDVAKLQEDLEKAEQIRVDVENEKRSLEWQQKQELEQKRLEILAENEGEVSEFDVPVVEDQFQPVSPNPVQVTNEVLHELALQREQAVIEYLIEQLSVDPRRLIRKQSNAKGIVSGGDTPRAVIGLTDGYAAQARDEEEEMEPEEPVEGELES